jgi:hypothetical protein
MSARTTPILQTAAHPLGEVVHYRELAVIAVGTGLVALPWSLACSVVSGERRCGRGATAAHFLPRADGAWICIPICEECARALGTAP